MNIIDELTEYFRKFPGVGPRQANRFVYYLLKQNPSFSNMLSGKIQSLHNTISTCGECFKYYIPIDGQNKCSICSSPNRAKSTLLIVSSDVDLDSIEKSGTYDGMYFVLGGSVPIMNRSAENYIRLNQLQTRIKDLGKDLKEIILALSANPEGENTAGIVKERIGDLIKENDIKISVLGRGLSTGTEIEYSDSETLKNALKNRF